ncbi:MAG: hypothetical protein IPJ49_04210 [Candidatus Obscuribacter sp.]|nr:hypothetical protein [Candidatus Obscuribacter sp.]
MFIDPMGHALLYSFGRPFVPADDVAKAEALLRKLHPTNGDMPINKEYWDLHVTLDPGYVKVVGDPPGKEDLVALKQLCDNSKSPVDWIVQLIPTFETPMGPNEAYKAIKFTDPVKGPHPVYKSYLDFMVNNRWAWDYCTMVDRLTPGVVKTYPMEVPEVDWWWMIGGALSMLYAGYVGAMCKKAEAEVKAKATPPATPTPAAAG